MGLCIPADRSLLGEGQLCGDVVFRHRLKGQSYGSLNLTLLNTSQECVQGRWGRALIEAKERDRCMGIVGSADCSIYTI